MLGKASLGLSCSHRSGGLCRWFDELNFDYIAFRQTRHADINIIQWRFSVKTRCYESFLLLDETFHPKGIPILAIYSAWRLQIKMIWALVRFWKTSGSFWLCCADGLSFALSSEFQWLERSCRKTYTLLICNEQKVMTGHSQPQRSDKIATWLQDFSINGVHYTPEWFVQKSMRLWFWLTSWMMWNAGIDTPRRRSSRLLLADVISVRTTTVSTSTLAQLIISGTIIFRRQWCFEEKHTRLALGKIVKNREYTWQETSDKHDKWKKFGLTQFRLNRFRSEWTRSASSIWKG